MPKESARRLTISSAPAVPSGVWPPVRVRVATSLSEAPVLATPKATVPVDLPSWVGSKLTVSSLATN